MTSFPLSTRSSVEFVDITAEVGRAAARNGADEGACLVFVPHTTAGVTVNEAADPSVPRDICKELNKIVPFSDGYLHGEGNSAAHIKASLVGSSVLVPISAGSLALGTWQGIFFCEFDGPRKRTVHVQVLKG
jgi:secondary thiamine-phosphate synthase enzyme